MEILDKLTQNGSENRNLLNFIKKYPALAQVVRDALVACLSSLLSPGNVFTQDKKIASYALTFLESRPTEVMKFVDELTQNGLKNQRLSDLLNKYPDFEPVVCNVLFKHIGWFLNENEGRTLMQTERFGLYAMAYLKSRPMAQLEHPELRGFESLCTIDRFSLHIEAYKNSRPIRGEDHQGIEAFTSLLKQLNALVSKNENIEEEQWRHLFDQIKSAYGGLENQHKSGMLKVLMSALDHAKGKRDVINVRSALLDVCIALVKSHGEVRDLDETGEFLALIKGAYISEIDSDCFGKMQIIQDKLCPESRTYWAQHGIAEWTVMGGRGTYESAHKFARYIVENAPDDGFKEQELSSLQSDLSEENAKKILARRNIPFSSEGAGIENVCTVM